MLQRGIHRLKLSHYSYYALSILDTYLTLYDRGKRLVGGEERVVDKIAVWVGQADFIQEKYSSG